MEGEKHRWGGSGEGECQVQGVRGREAHLGSLPSSPLGLRHLSLCCSCSGPNATGWKGKGGSPTASSVYPGERRESQAVREKGMGEGRKANELPHSSCFVLGGSRAALLAGR